MSGTLDDPVYLYGVYTAKVLEGCTPSLAAVEHAMLLDPNIRRTNILLTYKLVALDGLSHSIAAEVVGTTDRNLCRWLSAIRDKGLGGAFGISKPTLRQCIGCEKWATPEFFHKDRTYKGGRLTACKRCIARLIGGLQVVAEEKIIDKRMRGEDQDESGDAA